MTGPSNEQRPLSGAPSAGLDQKPELALQRTATVGTGKRVHDDTCACHCWHCTAGPAIDKAIVLGRRVTIDATDQVVIPDVVALELAANGIDVTDHAGYQVVHRSGDRTCWILSAGAVL